MPRFVISNLKTNRYLKIREWKEKGNFNTIIDSFLVENKENATFFTKQKQERFHPFRAEYELLSIFT